MKLARVIRMFALPAVIALTSVAAHADTFSWTLTGPAASLGGFPLPGSGTLTATETNVSLDEWTINSITGEVGGLTITNLTSFEGNNNLLFPAGTTELSTGGVSFVLSNGADVNVFSFFGQGSAASGNEYGELANGRSAGFGVGTFSAVDTTSPVPEPSTIALLGTGLLGAAGAIRRRVRA